MTPVRRRDQPVPHPPAGVRADDPKGGGVEHGARVFDAPTCLHRPEVVGGVREAEAAALFCALLRRAALTHILDFVKYLTHPPAMSDVASAETVAAVRRFSRFYTRRIGLWQDGLLDSPSAAEGRVLYELGQRDGATAVALAAELGLDQGYLSRLLRGLEQRGLLQRAPSQADRRASLLSLTPSGRDAFAALDAGSRAQIDALLGPLSAPERHRLAAALGEAV